MALCSISVGDDSRFLRPQVEREGEIDHRRRVALALLGFNGRCLRRAALALITTKNEFIVAALERGQRELAARLAPDESLPAVKRLDASLDAFLDYVEAHPAAFAAIFRGGSEDPEITKTLDAGRNEQLATLMKAIREWDEAPVSTEATPELEAAVQGWIFFCEGAVLRWLEHGEFPVMETHQDRVAAPTSLKHCMGQDRVTAKLSPQHPLADPACLGGLPNVKQAERIQNTDPGQGTDGRFGARQRSGREAMSHLFQPDPVGLISEE
jgi:hypothetical protein